MIRRSLVLCLALVAIALVGCQPPQEFGPNATDSDLWSVTKIRPDTEVPNQYPNGRSGLAGAGATEQGAVEGDTSEEDAH